MGSFQIRKIYTDGTLTVEKDGNEGDLDGQTIEQLYLPVKKYFIKKYKAPVVLNVHVTRTGVPCLDFIGDSRMPEDFNYDRVIDTYRKVVDVFTHSDYKITAMTEFKTNIGPCISYLSGDSNKINVHSSKYDQSLFALVRELYPTT